MHFSTNRMPVTSIDFLLYVLPSLIFELSSEDDPIFSSIEVSGRDEPRSENMSPSRCGLQRLDGMRLICRS